SIPDQAGGLPFARGRRPMRRPFEPMPSFTDAHPRRASEIRVVLPSESRHRANARSWDSRHAVPGSASGHLGIEETPHAPVGSFLRPEMNEFLDLLPAQQRLDEATWYRGTADAVYQNFDILKAARPEFFVVLAGDHIYKMDYSNMLADLRSKGADCIVACVEVPLAQASDFGVMAVDESMKIVDFLEKPPAPPSIPGKPDRALASMGIYAFSADFLYSELQRDQDDPKSSHDFGKDVIPNLVSRGLAAAHRFEDSCVKTTPDAEAYWRDVGTIDAYWAANLDLVRPTPSLDIYDPNWPIWTYQQQLPPAQ